MKNKIINSYIIIPLPIIILGHLYWEPLFWFGVVVLFIGFLRELF